MTKIELFERAITEGARDLEAYGINHTMFWAYCRSQRVGNDLINFDETIWGTDIEPIAACMKDNGITEFTISTNSTCLLNALAAFDKQGFKVAGITEVNATYNDFRTGEWERIPAIKMKLEGC